MCSLSLYSVTNEYLQWTWGELIRISGFAAAFRGGQIYRAMSWYFTLRIQSSEPDYETGMPLLGSFSELHVNYLAHPVLFRCCRLSSVSLESLCTYFLQATLKSRCTWGAEWVRRFDLAYEMRFPSWYTNSCHCGFLLSIQSLTVQFRSGHLRVI